MPRSKAEDAARKAIYRRNNPEKVAATQRNNYARNREKRLQQKREYYKANKDSLLEYQRAYRDANPEKLKQWRAGYCIRAADNIKNLRLKRQGFTLELKHQLIAQQNNRCAICSRDFTNLPAKHIHADHCHATGTPRGVLCHYCNLGLGKFQDDPDVLRTAAAYLEKHQAKEKTNA